MTNNIIPPGYLRWDGTKYILVSDINQALIFNNLYYLYFDGIHFTKINI